MPLNAPVSFETIKPRPRLLAALIAAGLYVCLGQSAVAQQTTDAIAPEASTAGSSSEMRKAANANNWMISAGNPLAVQAGANILRSGGNAIDAMVTIQTMLGLVEPQSSGIGGGAFLVYFDATRGKLTTLDGRETAPLNATPMLFQDENGEPLKFYDAVVGGRSVGTPGTPALMKAAHEKWGQLPWNSLFDPAIDIATAGFEVSPRLAALIIDDQEKLSRDPEAKSYFFDQDGAPLAAGTVLRNPKYAKTLQDLATNGTVNFYQGPVAQDIVDKVKGASWNPGVLSLADFATYHVKERPAVCIEYRDHDVCGMGPPSSGALTVGQILGLLEPYDIAAMGPESAQSWRLIGDASRLAFADRGRYMADIDFVPMPLTGLLDKTYLADRSKLLDRDTALETVEPGMPSFSHAMKLADDEAIELPSTSHFSIVDIYGNAVSMTTTIENGFGSRLMVNGFMLNNELTDFSFKTHSDGVPIANALAPGKRPRSSMAPTIVMKNDKPVIVTGSPGGSRIIGYVAQSLIGMIDWNMSPKDAIDMPHLVNRFGTFDLEAGTDAENLAPALEGMGFKTDIRDLNSGIHAIMITKNGLIGGADSRREGIVVGE
ncbi:gamma-glutamyltransferase [Thalassospira sp. ER-Se-21-Dark]|uniref:gamma-glutamyltransferase n=1 Tax=Thalassospira sp. ER-Se-21-Dark TaxID=2585190 RepID=UPI001DE1E4C5|nr:gamma-glutamyltransferase [Thalassospira sp. ER-Se-21-Dark]MBP3126334.1 gamma-glutamyltransferase [Thalassospira sp. ER-Se-21-Dark]